MVYGPRDQEVLKVFRLARLGVAPVFGDGTQELSAVHGADLADALVAAGTTAAAVGRTYYACHPEVFTGAEMALAVGRAMGRRPAVIRVPAGDRPRRAVLTEAAARLAGQTTILTADKANEFFQPAWTGDPAPLAATPAGAPAGTSRPGWRRPTRGTGRPDGCSRPAERPGARPPRQPRLLPVDVVLLGYLAIVSAVAVHRAARAAGLLVGGGGQRADRRAHRAARAPGPRPRGPDAARDLSAAAAGGPLRAARRAERGRGPVSTTDWCSAGSWRSSGRR